jgi:hypothetical protein
MKDAVLCVVLFAEQAILDELSGRRPSFVVNPEAYVGSEHALPSALTDVSPVRYAAQSRQDGAA